MMNKIGSLLFWILVTGMALFALYTIYDRFAESNRPPVVIRPGEDNGGNTAGGGNNKQADEDESNNGAGDKSGDESNELKKIPAPDFTLTDLKGGTVKLSDYKGKKVIINFWATWCIYCREEMPELDRLYSELAKGDEAVLLTVNVNEDSEVVKKYIDKEGFELPVLLDTDGKVGAMYGVNAFPTTFFVNSDGNVYGYLPSMTNREQLLDILSGMS